MAHFEFYEPPPEVKDQIAVLRAEMAANRVLLVGYRLEALLAKANFNPSQPRVPAGSSRGGEWTRVGGAGGEHRVGDSTTLRPTSGRVRSTNIALVPDPLMQREGNSRPGQISRGLSDISSGRTTSFSIEQGAGLERTTIRVAIQQNDQLTMDVSTSLASIRGRGTLSSEAGRATISNFTLTAPGFLNPLRIVSAPTQVTILDSPDGTLRFQIDGRLTVRGPLGVTVIDRLPGQYIIE